MKTSVSKSAISHRRVRLDPVHRGRNLETRSDAERRLDRLVEIGPAPIEVLVDRITDHGSERGLVTRRDPIQLLALFASQWICSGRCHIQRSIQHPHPPTRAKELR